LNSYISHGLARSASQFSGEASSQAVPPITPQHYKPRTAPTHGCRKQVSDSLGKPQLPLGGFYGSIANELTYGARRHHANDMPGDSTGICGFRFE